MIRKRVSETVRKTGERKVYDSVERAQWKTQGETAIATCQSLDVCTQVIGMRDRARRSMLCNAEPAQAMGPTLAALYCAAGPEWITNVIQAGSSRWKPQHYQWMKKAKPKRPYLLKAT